MLRVSLLGNLGAEPETRYSQKGSQITTFRVAVDQVRTDADGERQESTEWFRVRAMGRLDISHYQSRDGEPRVGFDVWADEVINLAGRPTGGDSELVGTGGRGDAPAEDPLDPEDLPF